MSAEPAVSSPTASTAMLDSSILHVLMETIPDRIYFKDLQSRFVRNNVAHARSLGAASPEECVGKTDFDYFAREHAERAFLDEQVIIRTGRPIIAKLERTTLRDGTKKWVSTTKMPWCDATGRVVGTFGLTRDVTEAKEAEEKLLEERNLLRTIIDHLPSRVFVKDRASRYLLNNRAHLAALGVRSQEEATGHTTTDFFPGERGLQALADDRDVFSGKSFENQEKALASPEGAVRWSLTTKVPFHDARGDILGLVGISHDITRRKLAETRLEERNAEMEADVRMARQIQEAFLPHTYPMLAGAAGTVALRFAHRYIPATTLGGDFFDLLQLSPTQCGILVCDVMGHGVRAGLLTALIRGVVAEMGPRAGDPAHVLGEINHALDPILAQTGEPVFTTAFYGVIDTTARTLTYANAGHPAPFVRHAGAAEPASLAAPDPEPAAGLVAGFAYTNHVCRFEPGALLIGYTDGVIEAADAAGNIFGDERLRSVLTTATDATGDEVLSRLVRAIEAYSGQSVFEDDVCLVAVEAMKSVAS